MRVERMPPVIVSCAATVRPFFLSRPSTTSSIACSSRPKTASPSTPRMIFSSVSSSLKAVASSSHLAVTRTLMPSMPLALKAMVGLPDLSSSAMRPVSISSMPDSLNPQVRNVRLRMTADWPERRRRSGKHGAGHHLLHFPGNAGNRINHLVADRTDEARRRARHLRDRRGADGDIGLPQIVGRHRAPARFEHLADLDGDLLVAAHLDAHDLGDHIARDVVLRGAETATADHRVRALQRLPNARFHAGEVVADLDLEVRVDAGQCQLLTDPGRIAIDDDAEQKLGADGDDFTAHGESLDWWEG